MEEADKDWMLLLLLLLLLAALLHCSDTGYLNAWAYVQCVIL